MKNFFLDCGCGCDGVRQEKKFLVSLMFALIFVLFSSPMAFKFTEKLFGLSGTSSLVFHGLLFMFIVWTALNLKSEFMAGALTPFPPAQSGSSVQNTMTLPDLPAMENPYADPSMLQPNAENYMLDDGPAPPAPPPTQDFLPSPIIPADFTLSPIGFVDFEQQPRGTVQYASL